MEVSQILDSFSDMFFIVKDMDGNIVCASNNLLVEYSKYFMAKPNNEYYSPIDNKWYQETSSTINDGPRKLAIYRYIDITEQKKYINEFEIDNCTGIPVRKKLLKDFRDYILEAIEEREEFSVVMGDIDHFKKVNDTFGHQAGDAVLRTAAQSLKNNIRQQSHTPQSESRKPDIVGRYGGEEFIIVLKNIPRTTTLVRIEQIRKKIASKPTDYIYPSDDKKIAIPITTSFGVIHVPASSLKLIDSKTYTPETLMNQVINEADTMLYESKNKGRNRTTFETFRTNMKIHKENEGKRLQM